MTRLFPVMKIGNRARKELEKDCPGEIPFSIIEKHRTFIKKVHSQTLERLSERGGLGPEELYYDLQELRMPFAGDSKMISLEKAIKWLKTRIKRERNGVNTSFGAAHERTRNNGPDRSLG